MPTPRSLLHLDGANGSTTVANEVTGGSAVAWAFTGAAGGALTTASPYLGSAMALLGRNQLLGSAPVSTIGDWTLGFRIGQAYNPEGGYITVVSQGRVGATGCWTLLMGGADLYLYSQVAGVIREMDYSLIGKATAINAKILAGNAFMCIQYIRGVLSVGLAGANETSVAMILQGRMPFNQTPAGSFHFNGFLAPGSDSTPTAETGTSRIDEVFYQDGHAAWPTYPFAKPVGAYSFAGYGTAEPVGQRAVGSVGAAGVSGTARAIAAGVAGASAVGVASAHGDADAPATGLAGQASLGQVAVDVEAMVPANGVQAGAAVGAARAAGDATATPQGAQGLGAVGIATIDIVRIAASDWIRYVIPAERRSFTLAPEARTWTLRKP